VLTPRSHIVEPMTTGSVAALVSRYGLLAVFGGTLLEGEGILIVAATLSAEGMLDPVRVWMAASTGPGRAPFVPGSTYGSKRAQLVVVLTVLHLPGSPEQCAIVHGS
jgi:hypothetical protein